MLPSMVNPPLVFVISRLLSKFSDDLWPLITLPEIVIPFSPLFVIYVWFVFSALIVAVSEIFRPERTLLFSIVKPASRKLILLEPLS